MDHEAEMFRRNRRNTTSSGSISLKENWIVPFLELGFFLLLLIILLLYNFIQNCLERRHYQQAQQGNSQQGALKDGVRYVNTVLVYWYVLCYALTFCFSLAMSVQNKLCKTSFRSSNNYSWRKKWNEIPFIHHQVY